MDEQLTQTLQQQLRDIHLPDAISWWPLALGWWLLIIILITLTSWGLYYLRQRQQLNRYRKLALNELNAHFADWQSSANTSVYLHSANTLLKRITQHIDPNSQHAYKTGQAWIKALNNYTEVPLSNTVINALTVANYQPNPSVDIANLHTLLCRWIEVHQRPIAPQKNQLADKATAKMRHHA